MMSSELVVQTKGSGSSFQNSVQVLMVEASSLVEAKLVFVSTRRVRIENQVSIRLSHDDKVGVKWRCQRCRLGVRARS
jgi:hypothetical protein